MKKSNSEGHVVHITEVQGHLVYSNSRYREGKTDVVFIYTNTKTPNKSTSGITLSIMEKMEILLFL